MSNCLQDLSRQFRGCRINTWPRSNNKFFIKETLNNSFNIRTILEFSIQEILPNFEFHINPDGEKKNFQFDDNNLGSTPFNHTPKTSAFQTFQNGSEKLLKTATLTLSIHIYYYPFHDSGNSTFQSNHSQINIPLIPSQIAPFFQPLQPRNLRCNPVHLAPSSTYTHTHGHGAWHGQRHGHRNESQNFNSSLLAGERLRVKSSHSSALDEATLFAPHGWTPADLLSVIP